MCFLREIFPFAMRTLSLPVLKIDEATGWVFPWSLTDEIHERERGRRKDGSAGINLESM